MAWYHFSFLTPPIILIFFFCAVRYSFRCRKDGPYAALLRQIHLIRHFHVHHVHRFHHILVYHVLYIHHDHVQRKDGPSAALLHHVLGQASRLRGSECQGGRMLGRFLYCGRFFISIVFFCLVLSIAALSGDLQFCCRIFRTWMGLGTKATPMWRWVLEIHKKEPVLRSSCLLQVMPWWHVKVYFHTKSDKSQVSTRWSLTRTSKRQRLLKATGTQSSRNFLALSHFRWGKILSSIFDHRTFSKLNPMGNEVFFEVWDKDRLSKDDLMGKVVALFIWKSIRSLGRKCYIK